LVAERLNRAASSLGRALASHQVDITDSQNVLTSNLADALREDFKLNAADFTKT
jgi:hypothetical protein